MLDQRPLSGHSGDDRIARRAEGNEEGVALHVDLPPAGSGECLSE